MTTYQNANDRPAGVTTDGRLMVEMVNRDYSYHVTANNEMGYTMYLATVTPTGADVFFTLQNTHDKPLLIQEVRLFDALAAGEHINFQVGAVWPIAGGAAIEPVNRKVSSTLLASSYATIEQGVALSGHTGVTMHTAELVQNVQRAIDFKNRPVVLAQNRAFDLEAETGTGAIRVEVDFMWLEPADYTDN
jgi:hypothetical protein